WIVTRASTIRYASRSRARAGGGRRACTRRRMPGTMEGHGPSLGNQRESDEGTERDEDVRWEAEDEDAGGRPREGAEGGGGRRGGRRPPLRHVLPSSDRERRGLSPANLARGPDPVLASGLCGVLDRPGRRPRRRRSDPHLQGARLPSRGAQRG